MVLRRLPPRRQKAFTWRQPRLPGQSGDIPGQRDVPIPLLALPAACHDKLAIQLAQRQRPKLLATQADRTRVEIEATPVPAAGIAFGGFASAASSCTSAAAGEERLSARASAWPSASPPVSSSAEACGSVSMSG